MEFTPTLRGAAHRAARRAFRRRYRDSLPKGPDLLGQYQLYRWLSDPIGFLERDCAGLGERFTVRLPGFANLVIFTDPEGIREVFTGAADDLLAGQANRALEPFMGKSSVLILDGEPHLRQRRLLLPPFHGARMEEYGALMCETAERVVARFPEDQRFELHPHMQDLTLEVILRAVFGVEDEGELSTLTERLARVTDLAANPFHLLPIFQRDLGPGSPWRRFRAHMGETNAMLYRLIARRRAEGSQGRKDVLSILIDARHEDGRPMSDVELRDELITMLIAGHETSATSLAWCAHRLFEHPEIAARVIAEVDAETPDGRVTPEAVARMKLLDGFVRETLRLNPIVPMVGRRLARRTTVAGLDLPKDTVVAPSIYLTHRNPRVWEDPLRFDPTRFVDRKVSPYAYFPFGGGIRKCIGMPFALYEIRLALAVMLRRVALRAVPGVVTRVVRRSITFVPSDGMPVISRRRRVDAHAEPAAGRTDGLAHGR